MRAYACSHGLCTRPVDSMASFAATVVGAKRRRVPAEEPETANKRQIPLQPQKASPANGSLQVCFLCARVASVLVLEVCSSLFHLFPFGFISNIADL